MIQTIKKHYLVLLLFSTFMVIITSGILTTHIEHGIIFIVSFVGISIFLTLTRQIEYNIKEQERLYEITYVDARRYTAEWFPTGDVVCLRKKDWDLMEERLGKNNLWVKEREYIKEN